MPSLVIEPGDLAALLAAIPRVLEICRAANEF
jgi:hypothetical protein